MSHPDDEIQKKSRAIVPTATQLRAPESWGISDTKLFLEEISTGAAVTRHCGSIFGRREASGLLDAIEAAFEIHVQGLPLWLRNIDFIRSATIRGSRMRRIKVPKIMDDLNMFRLSGLATFIVLCCRYSEDEDNLNKMVELLVVGDLGTIIKIDRDLYPRVPYTFKGHIGTFITSCLDADRYSDTSRQVNTWMAELHDFGELTWHSRDLFVRKKQASIDLMNELLGAAGHEEDMARRAGQSLQASTTDDQAGGWAKIHNTLHLTTAYIALAAAAHKACVVVECISSHGSKMFPKELDPEKQKTAFLVRLWLVQPPEHVRSILRQSGRSFTPDVDRQNDQREDSDEEVVVVGGTLELATWIARKLEFRCNLTENTEAETLLELWRGGVDYGKKLRWSTKMRLSTANFGMLLFALETPEQRSNLPAEAVPLCKALLSIDKRLKPVAREVAKIVDGFYRLDDYSSFLGDDEGVFDSEYVKAMYFVITSISIQTLCNTMNPAGDNIDFYAFNLATLNGGTRDLGNLHDLFRSALHDGVAPFKLLMTAASVWGGAQFRSTGRPAPQRPVDHVLGVVTRQCTVIFDIIRDPLAFVLEGSMNRLISIWRGAVPMLPRDPVTNFVYGGADDRRIPSEVRPDYTPKPRPPGYQVKGQILVTFEPFDTEATHGIFCFWYEGHLIAEFAPHCLLVATLAGLARNAPSIALSSPGPSQSIINTQRRAPQTFVELTKSDLLDLRGFTVKGNAGVIVKGLGDAAWATFALGCAAGPSVSSHHLLTFIYRGDPNHFDIEEFRGHMNEGQVIIMVP